MCNQYEGSYKYLRRSLHLNSSIYSYALSLFDAKDIKNSSFETDISTDNVDRPALGDASPCISKRLHYACRPVATLSYLAPFHCSFRPNPPATTKRSPPPPRLHLLLLFLPLIHLPSSRALLLVFLLVRLIETALYSSFRPLSPSSSSFLLFSHLVNLDLDLPPLFPTSPLLDPFFKHVDFSSREMPMISR